MAPELFYKHIPESLYIENWGTILSPYYFNVILSAKLVWPNMTSETLYVKTLPTP